VHRETRERRTGTESASLAGSRRVREPEAVAPCQLEQLNKTLLLSFNSRAGTAVSLMYSLWWCILPDNGLRGRAKAPCFI